MIRAAGIVLGLALGLAPFAASAQTFGALSYSPDTGGWGSAYNYGNRAGAEQRALAECTKNHRGCRKTIWFRDACGALAQAPNGGWGSGWGSSVDLAMVEAINSCESHGNTGCSILTTLCSSQ